MSVAIGRCIDDDLDAFALALGQSGIVRLARRAVDGAEIDRRIGWRAPPCNLAEFARVIGRKENIMMAERKAFGGGMGIPHQRRERAFGRRDGGHRA
jgi:hypothetical protein